MKFDITQYKGDYAMHCETREDAQTFLAYLQKMGRTWCDGASYDNLNFSKYKDRTGYAFNEGKYGTIGWYNDHEYTVLEFYDFEWDDDITPPRAATFSVSIISLHNLLLISYKRSNTRAL